MTDKSDYKAILLNLIGSLTLDETRGDVAESVEEALRLAGYNDYPQYYPEDDLEFRDWLDLQGATTLYGTKLVDYD